MENIYKNLHSNQKILIYEMLKRGISVEVLDESLELIKLDTLAGHVSIKGNINSIEYIMENTKKNKEESVFSRLFK